MRFEVTHVTRYSYGTSVFVEQQTLRLKPLTNANQRLIDFDLRITPQPALLSELVDIDGNSSIVIWPDGRTDMLTIEARSQVETLRPNAFDFLWQGERSLPLTYEPSLAPSLAPFRGPGGIATREFARKLAASSSVEESAQVFPYRLAAVLQESLVNTVRPEGEPLPADETLALGEGSCRDQAVVFMAICREMGFAARFVSGYHAVEADQHELHAWAEVYLPGGGWRGFDPTAGIATSDRHIAIATGAESSQAAPVSGTFRGRRSALMETSVSVRPLGDE